MCVGCWESYGSPKIVNTNTLLLADLIDQIYEYNPVGSNAHIFTDDFNIEDDNITSCLRFVEENEHGSTAQQQDIERKMLNLALSLSEAERASALAIHWEIIIPEDYKHDEKLSCC